MREHAARHGWTIAMAMGSYNTVVPSFTRKEFLGIAAGSLSLNVRAAPALQRRPKNVLLVMCDQHKHQALSIDGDPVAHTPNLDALARSGIRFDSAYCSNPVCVPARASLLTGLYTHHHHTWNNTTPLPFEHKTIAHYLGRAGYMSALIGKMHFVDAQTHGFDYKLDFNDWFQYLGPKTKLWADELGLPNSGSGQPQIDDLWRDFGDPWKDVREPDGRKGAVSVGGISKIPDRDQFESFVARESIRFLKEHGKQQPFFLVTSFLKPHDPFMPSARFAARYPPESMRLPDTWGKVDLDTVPREIRNAITLDRPTPELKDPAQAKRRISYYYASLEQMDEAAGQVLKALDDLGLAEDTLVVYTSDHGEMLGEHGLWNKFVFYEPSVAVPLIFHVPGLTQANARCATPISITQVMPTILEICGVPVPSGIDGESLVRDLRQPAATRQTTVYSEYALRSPGAKYMIRRGDYKYCHYDNDTPELYNLRGDPKEMHNLAATEKSRAAEMDAEILAWRAK